MAEAKWIALWTLSVMQPWAGLAVAGIKPIEVRSWTTKHRGPLLIHASRTPLPGGVTGALRRVRDRLGVEPELASELLRVGGIIGVVHLADIRRATPSPWAFVSPDPWHWILERARPLPFHPCPGRQGLFRVEYPYPLVSAPRTQGALI